jgi:hypothetical protein
LTGRAGKNRAVAPTPAPSPSADPDPALDYALRQLRWYRRARSRARFFHQAGELTILLTTAATVVVAALNASAPVTAALAAVTLFLTGFRQVFSPNENWVRAARTWLALDHAVLRYRLMPEAERGAGAQQALMEEVIAICDEENNEWAVQQYRRAAPDLPAGAAAVLAAKHKP